jgi:HK97 family phage major capsid protein
MTEVLTKEAIQAAVQEKLDKFAENLKGFATVDDILKATDAMKAEVEPLAKTSKEIAEKMNKVEKAAIEQGLAITKIQTAGVQEKRISLPEYLYGFKDKFAAMAKDPGAQFVQMEMGSYGRKTTNEAINASITTDYQGMRLPGVGQLPHLRPVLRDIFNIVPVGPNSHGTIYYTDQLAVTRSAAAESEGTAAPVTSDITWEGYHLPIEEIKDSIKISRKALENTDFMAGEIQNFILTNLALAEDSALWAGTGVSPIIYGVNARATAYTNTIGVSYVGKVKVPTLYDLANCLDGIVKKNTMFRANVLILSVEDSTALFNTKDTLGRILMPPYAVIDPKDGTIRIKGMQVFESSQLTANTCAIGDFNFANLYTLGGVQLQLGYVNTDFTRGMVTVLGWLTEAMLIKTINQTAFYYVSDINAALSGLTASA